MGRGKRKRKRRARGGGSNGRKGPAAVKVTGA